MGSMWRPFHVPPEGEPFLGEFGYGSLTDKRYALGYLRKCRNYHLGLEGMLKREGERPYRAIGDVHVAGTGSTAVQSLVVHDWDLARTLLALCGGNLKYWNGSSWATVTGALAFSSSQNDRLRTVMFNNGSSTYLVGAQGGQQLFKWDGTSSNAAALSGTPPTRAVGIAEFQGRIFVCNTDAGETATEFSDDGTVDSWSAGQVFHASRKSPAIGFANHSENLLLLFHRESWHYIEYQYVDAGIADSYFKRGFGGNKGAISPDGIVTHRNRTYFAADDGIYEIINPQLGRDQGGWRYISRGIEPFWKSLRKDRKPYIQAFERGAPFQNEIVFFVSKDSTSKHDHAIVYNSEVGRYKKDAGFTIFENASGFMQYNCGVNFIDGNGENITLLGGYDGYVYEAWGSEEYSTGYKDKGTNGGAVQTTALSGYLDCGRSAWIKGLRAFQGDLQLYNARNFDLTIYGSNQQVALAEPTVAAGSGGDVLGEFLFGGSLLAADGISDFEEEIDGSARYFQWQLQENSTERPHSLSATRLMHVMERIGIE